MGNFYLLNEQERWAVVCIAKNACTSMKARVLRDHGVDTTEISKAMVHNKVGYTAASEYLYPVGDHLDDGWTKFVVVRDPVERFVSAFRHFAVDGHHHTDFACLKGAPFDVWMDFAEEELKKPVLMQDEHMRCQVDYCRREDVDVVVPLKKIDGFFRSNGWRMLGRENRSKGEFVPTPVQVERCRWIYRRDSLGWIVR